VLMWLLPSLNHARPFSISGHSAGASMSIQHLFAHSEVIEGAAVSAGSPYGCGVLDHAFIKCEVGMVDTIDLN
jgi:poly(3-hydroxybutyrate) depolymerase